MAEFKSLTYRIPGERVMTANVGTELWLTPFHATGETVQRIRSGAGSEIVIETDVQHYGISEWRHVNKETL